MNEILLAVAGGLGAATRFVLDSWVARHNRVSFPLGTAGINVTGSLLLGLLAGWAMSHGGTGEWGTVLGTGFLGGYTTFSTASVEGVRLFRAERRLAAAVHAGGMLLASVAAAGLGVWITR